MTAFPYDLTCFIYPALCAPDCKWVATWANTCGEKWTASLAPFWRKDGAWRLSVKSLLASARTELTKEYSSLLASKSSFSLALFSSVSSMTFWSSLLWASLATFYPVLVSRGGSRSSNLAWSSVSLSSRLASSAFKPARSASQTPWNLLFSASSSF